MRWVNFSARDNKLMDIIPLSILINYIYFYDIYIYYSNYLYYFSVIYLDLFRKGIYFPFVNLFLPSSFIKNYALDQTNVIKTLFDYIIHFENLSIPDATLFNSIQTVLKSQ